MTTEEIIMTTKEIENLTDSLTEEYERCKDDLTIKDYTKRVIGTTNLYWQEKTRWKSLLDEPPKLPTSIDKERLILIKHAKGGYDTKFLVKQSSIDMFLRDGFVAWKEIE